MPEALVVFDGTSSHPFSFLLKSGFKHCFVSVKSDGYWIEVDKVKNRTTVRVMANADYDLRAHYEKSGYKVVTVEQQSINIWRFNPFYGNIMVANCVGSVKHILSMGSLALTPYQLYKGLSK